MVRKARARRDGPRVPEFQLLSESAEWSFGEISNELNRDSKCHYPGIRTSFVLNLNVVAEVRVLASEIGVP